MRTYETMFVVKPDLEEEALNGVVEKFQALIQDQGGTVDKVDRWGKRKLAYSVKGYNDGYYVVIYFKGEPKAVQELERVLKITDGVLKYLIVKNEDQE